MPPLSQYGGCVATSQGGKCEKPFLLLKNTVTLHYQNDNK